MKPVLAALATRLVAAVASALAAAGVASAGELAVGDASPDFSLRGSDGETHTLSELRGERAVVLAWYPRAFTSGCTIECKSLARNGERIRAYDVAYFMASVDPFEENRRFARAQNADFPLLSDPTKETAAAYGVLAPAGHARRWTFYIGIDGNILAIDKDVRPATAAEDMVERLAELGIARTPEAGEDASE